MRDGCIQVVLLFCSALLLMLLLARVFSPRIYGRGDEEGNKKMGTIYIARTHLHTVKSNPHQGCAYRTCTFSTIICV